MRYVDYAALQNDQYCACWSHWSSKAKALLSCNGRIFCVESMRNRETTPNVTKSTIQSRALSKWRYHHETEGRCLVHIEQEVCSARRDAVPVHNMLYRADQEKWSQSCVSKIWKQKQKSSSFTGAHQGAQQHDTMSLSETDLQTLLDEYKIDAMCSEVQMVLYCKCASVMRVCVCSDVYFCMHLHLAHSWV